MKTADIIFPHLFGGFEIQSINPVAISLFGVEVYWYGIIIVTGILMGLLTARIRAKQEGQDPDIYSDFLVYALIGAIIGARLYYVAFSWDSYKDNLMAIFNTRQGGLAIYGGVIGAVIALAIFSKIKKLDFRVMADTAVPGLILGQAIGRWGNFMNMEAFGGSSNGYFAMALNVDKVKYIPSHMINDIVTLGGGDYLQVQPTFLYESLWNLGVFAVLLFFTSKKAFKGEIFLWYLLGYGAGRAWIEGLRTDQLLIADTGLAISQVLAVVLVFVSLIWIGLGRRQVKRKESRD